MPSFLPCPCQHTIVRRDGEELIIGTEHLCVGDVVKVKAGDRIPADIRVIEVHGFKVKRGGVHEAYGIFTSLSTHHYNKHSYQEKTSLKIGTEI